MTALVLDANVAVKWALPSYGETLVAESVLLLTRYAKGEINFIVPDVFWVEVANALCKGVRRQRWPDALAEIAGLQMRERDFFTVSSQVLFPEALKISFAYDLSISECLYVALALQSKTEMITADERLANTLAAHLPVKWLGAFSPERE